MDNPDETPTSQKLPLQWRLFSVVLALGIAGAVMVFLMRRNLTDSAALYMGIPLILALTLSLAPKSTSALGATMKGITIALLLSAIVFQEGYICILFAAPLFYAIGALAAIPIDLARKRNRKPIQAGVVATVLALLSLEGTSDVTTFPRDAEVSASKVVAAPIAAVRTQLLQPPHFDGPKPFFLRIFPYPAAFSGSPLKVGAEEKIDFVAYKHIWWTRVEGELTLKVAVLEPDRMSFVATSDKSYLSHYLDWQKSEIVLRAIDATHTEVTWTLAYRRILDPSWYFSPMQRYAVRLTAEELIDHVATPDRP